MKVSVIIRTRNEERWISSCLESVFGQHFDEFEVILVDNMSEDATVSKASQYPVKIVTIKNYFPGLAINEGVRASLGTLIICLSGHCIPVDSDWVEALVKPLSESRVAGVYGRQQPMSFTTDRDKRDLLTTFGLDPKVQRVDTFFHNANSAFRRETWERFPFDEAIPHIEDRMWARDVLAAGMEIHYEPKASVFHYHGIYQNDNPQRRRNVVKILESLSTGEKNIPIRQSANPSAPDPKDLNTVALIPVRGDPVLFRDEPQLEFTLKQVKQSKFVKRTFVLTDSKKTADYAIKNGAEAPFLRPKSLSREFVDITEVLKFGIEELENWNIFPDICLVLEENYPFRPPGLIDNLIVSLLREGTDCAIAAKDEVRSIWVERENGLETVSPLIPRKFKTEKFYISLFGLAFATYPAYIRDGSLGIGKPYIFTVHDPIAMMEVRNDQQRSSVADFLRTWKTYDSIDS